MASRPIVPPQHNNRGGGAVVAKTGTMQEGNNNTRRALGDIGNIVTVRGIEGKLDRPITRSFGAQLLANAQAKASDHNKDQVTVVVDGRVVTAKGGGPPEAVKPVQKKVVTIKPEPEMIIEISPDTTEEKNSQNRKALFKEETSRSRRKKVHTFTSVLAARSKVACGLTNGKPKDLVIVDIDAADKDNHLAAVEYVEDIYKFYKLVEHSNEFKDYMESQPEINAKMRAILVDWLIEVHNKFELMPETLYLTIYIVDQYLSMKSVMRKQLQLLGISAMLIASKYEEIWAPEVNDFVCISDRTYNHEQILSMEKSILGILEWNLTVPTPYVFLVRYIKASGADAADMENMVFYLAELGLMHYEILNYCPSMIAASAVYATRSTLSISPLWNETLKLYTGFSEPHLLDCAKLLVKFHSGAAEDKLQVVRRKYTNPSRGAVALLPPAKTLLA